MKIQVQVKIQSKKEMIEKQEDGSFIVRINTPPVEGKANKRVIELLSKYFRVAKTKIRLVSGEKSKKKSFEIELT